MARNPENINEEAINEWHLMGPPEQATAVLPMGHMETSLSMAEMVAIAISFENEIDNCYSKAGICTLAILDMMPRLKSHVTEASFVPLVAAVEDFKDDFLTLGDTPQRMIEIVKLASPLSIYIDNVRSALNLAALFRTGETTASFMAEARTQDRFIPIGRHAPPNEFFILYTKVVAGAWLLYDQITAGNQTTLTEKQSLREELKQHVMNRLAEYTSVDSDRSE
jgi:hypothetical protein